MQKDNTGEGKIGMLGRLITFGISAILAAFIAKKMQEYYPDTEFIRFVKGMLALVILMFIVVFIGVIVYSIISGIWNAISPGTNSMVEHG